jgi:WD40 repeat protein
MKNTFLLPLWFLFLLLNACAPTPQPTPEVINSTGTPIPPPAYTPSLFTPSPTVTLPLEPGGSNAAPITAENAGRVQRLRTLTGHSHAIYGLAFSPDGRFLASSTLKGDIRVWDRETWRTLREFQATNIYGWRLFFLADSAHVVSGNGMLWDIASGELEKDPGRQQTVAFSPDGAWMAAVRRGQSRIELWQVVDWQLEREIGTSPSGDIFALAFSPDGRLIATATNFDPNGPQFVIKIWDVATGEELFDLQCHQDAIHALAFSPDGRWLASASMDTTVAIWDVRTGQLVETLHTSAQLFDATFSPDSNLVAAALNNNTVELWDVTSGQLVKTLDHAGEVVAVAFSPDGTLLASGAYDAKVYIWGIP